MFSRCVMFDIIPLPDEVSNSHTNSVLLSTARKLFIYLLTWTNMFVIQQQRGKIGTLWFGSRGA